MSLPDCLLMAEPYDRRARMFEWTTGKQWTMPHLEWLFDECADFIAAGKLESWLEYYGHFAGMDDIA